MSRRRPILLVLAGAGCAAIGLVLVLRDGGTVDALRDLVGTGGSCSAITDDARTPDRTRDYPQGFARRAERIEVVGCEAAGPVTTYMRFSSAESARAALARFPRVRRLGICRIGRETFDAHLLGYPRRAGALCRRLGGTGLPGSRRSRRPRSHWLTTSAMTEAAIRTPPAIRTACGTEDRNSTTMSMIVIASRNAGHAAQRSHRWAYGPRPNSHLEVTGKACPRGVR